MRPFTKQPANTAHFRLRALTIRRDGWVPARVTNGINPNPSQENGVCYTFPNPEGIEQVLPKMLKVQGRFPCCQGRQFCFGIDKAFRLTKVKTGIRNTRYTPGPMLITASSNQLITTSTNPHISKSTHHVLQHK